MFRKKKVEETTEQREPVPPRDLTGKVRVRVYIDVLADGGASPHRNVNLVDETFNADIVEKEPMVAVRNVVSKLTEKRVGEALMPSIPDEP